MASKNSQLSRAELEQLFRRYESILYHLLEVDDCSIDRLYKCFGCKKYSFTTDPQGEFNEICGQCQEAYCNECIEKIYPLRFADYKYIESQDGGGSYVKVGKRRGCILHESFTICEKCDLFCYEEDCYVDVSDDGNELHKYCDLKCAQNS